MHPVPRDEDESMFQVLVLVAILILLTTRQGEIGHALLHANTRLTSQRFVRMDQPVLVLEPLHHFLDCSVHTQSSHVQQCGFYECDHELE